MESSDKEMMDSIAEQERPEQEGTDQEKPGQGRSDQEVINESLQLQKAVWVRDEIERRRKEEDALLDQIFAEQKALHELNENVDENMKHASEGRRYREEMKERLNRQVYAMHDLSEDKMEGMKEYSNAYHKGFALAMFLMSLVLCVFCGYLNGIASQITLAMLFFTALQGAVLIQETRCFLVWKWICRLAQMLTFPGMLVLFIGNELGYSYYERALKYSLSGAFVFLALTMAAYFLYDPYRTARGRIRDAKSTIRNVERIARKQVKKNQKTRIKEENRAQKQQDKEESRAEKLRKKEADRAERLRQKEENRAEKLRQKEEKRAEKLRQKEEDADQRQEKSDQKKEAFLSRFRKAKASDDIPEPADFESLPEDDTKSAV